MKRLVKLFTLLFFLSQPVFSTVSVTAPCLEDKGTYCLVGGDMILDKNDPGHAAIIQNINDHYTGGSRSKSRAIQTNLRKWPNGVVKYTLSGFSSSEEAVINTAIDSIENVCNVRFQKWSGTNYVYNISKITDPEIGGRSTVGYIKNAYCQLSSVRLGTAIHEFLHGLGFGHEHQRSDRLVKINYDNIKPKYKGNFETVPAWVDGFWWWQKNEKKNANYFGSYDFNSIMHYPSYAFSKNGKKTIDAGSNSIGQRRGLSAVDKYALIQAYGASGSFSTEIYPSNTTGYNYYRTSYKLGGRSASAWLTGDINGDGRTDLFQPWKQSSGSLGLEVYTSSSNKLNLTWSNTWSDLDLGGHGALCFLTGDVNGNGKTDIIRPWNNNGNLSVELMTSQGSSFKRTWSGNMGEGAGAITFQAADVTGDGKCDLIQIWDNNGTAEAIVYKSTGSGFTKLYGSRRLGGRGAIKWFVGDVTGDNKADIVQLWNNNGSLAVELYASNGYGFYHKWASSNMGEGHGALTYMFGDVNGDDKKDIVQVWNNNGRANAIIYQANVNGFHKTYGNRSLGGKGATSWNLADVNGDGKKDIVQTWNNGGQSSIEVYRSTGNGFNLVSGGAKRGLPNGMWFVGESGSDNKEDLIHIY